MEIGKDEGAGGGEKAGNSKKQSSRSLFPSPSHKQVGIKKKRYVGMLNTYMLQTVTQIFNNWRQKVQRSRSVVTKIKRPLQPSC